MSDKIYFNASNKFSLKKSLVNVSTRLHHRLAPKHAEKMAGKILMTPNRMSDRNAVPTGLKEFFVDSKEGRLQAYSLGTGPVWTLTHGWSGSSNQFFPLMEHIAAQGFTAVAYDHPAHGKSEGLVGHIPGFVQGLEDVLDSQTQVAGVIAHSMGSASVLECRHEKLKNIPILLIAPVLKYLENMFNSIERSGFSMRLANKVIDHVAQQYHYPIHSIDPWNKLKLRTATTLIVHDEEDRFSPFSVSEQAAQENALVEIIASQGQGHGRVMTCDQAKLAFDRLAKVNAVNDEPLRESVVA